MSAKRDPTEQEISELVDRYFYLEARYQGLIAAFQMLRPLIESKSYEADVRKRAKQRSASLT
jgi:hypothetical protein